MIPSDFFVEVADFQQDRDAIAAVREPVFIVEQGVPAEVVWDALDPHCRHVLARDLQRRPIGCGRLTPQHSIGRMAVLPEWRGKGVGGAMLTALIDIARELRYPRVELHSQLHAVPFYQRHGFVVEGDVYQEAGIDHQTMSLPLAQREPLQRESAPPSRESAEIEFHSLEEARDWVLSLLRQTQRQLWIHSRDLDPELFHGEAILAELRRIATHGRNAEIRILVQDPLTAQKHGGALLQLAQKLSTAVHILQPDNEVDLQFAGAYLLTDAAGVMTRTLATRWDGMVQEHAPGHHRQLLDQFRQVWERARPASELRAQSL